MSSILSAFHEALDGFQGQWGVSPERFEVNPALAPPLIEEFRRSLHEDGSRLITHILGRPVIYIDAASPKIVEAKLIHPLFGTMVYAVCFHDREETPTEIVEAMFKEIGA